MKTRKSRRMRFYILMMAFPVIQFCITFLGTNVNSLLLSFKSYDAELNYTWTMQNFADVIVGFFKDEFLQDSFVNSSVFYVITTGITVPVSLLISFYLYKKLFMSKSLKIILFLPSVISSVVAVTCFYYIADKGWPMIVELLTGREVKGLLVDTSTRVPTLLFYNIFYGLAGGFIFYSSAMGGIDTSVSEACQVDGANLWQEFRYITLPMIFPTLFTFLTSGVSGAFIGDYGMYAFAKTSGTAAVPTMGYYITNGVVNDTSGVKYPYYSALGIVLSIVTTLLVFLVRKLLRKMDPFANVDGTQERRRRHASK